MMIATPALAGSTDGKLQIKVLGTGVLLVEVLQGDIRDRALMARACARIERVIHAAAWRRAGISIAKRIFSHDMGLPPASRSRRWIASGSRAGPRQGRPTSAAASAAVAGSPAARRRWATSCSKQTAATAR